MAAEAGSVRLERFLELPIGGAEGLPDEVVPTPTTSLVTAKPPGVMRAPVRLCAAPNRELLVLAADPAGGVEPGPALVLGYTREGALERRTPVTPVTPARGWRIVDYAAASDGSLYLLEQSAEEGMRNHLRRLTAAGEVVWHRSGRVIPEGVDLEQLDGGFDRILVDRGAAAYLSAARRLGLVARIDGSTGKLEPHADWGDYRGDAFMDGSGVVYYVQYLPQTGLRYWVRLDPEGGEVSQVAAGAELSDYLARPVGVDDRGRAYGVAGTRMACMAEDGSPAWIFGCEGLVPGADGAAWTSVSRREDGRAVVEVRSWAPGSGPGEPARLVVPPGVAAPEGVWRLLRVDDGHYVVFGGETPSRAGAIVIFSREGEVREVVDPAPPDVRLSGYWLQPPSSWNVALDGSVYLPVTGPDRVEVLRLTAD
jgi:hypothetical protein